MSEGLNVHMSIWGMPNRTDQWCTVKRSSCISEGPLIADLQYIRTHTHTGTLCIRSMVNTE